MIFFKEATFRSRFIALIGLMVFSSGFARNLIPGDSSFEAGAGSVIGGATEGGVTRAFDTKEFFNGKYSAKLNYPQFDSMESQPINIPIELDNKTFTFSIYAKADQDKVPAKLYMVKPTLKKSISVPIVLSKEWKRYSVSGQLNSGDYLLGLQMHKSGTVWVDAFQLEEGNKATDYQNNGNLCVGASIQDENNYTFYEGEAIPLKIFAADIHGSAPDKTDITLSISNWKKKVIAENSWNCDFKEGRAVKEYTLPELGAGWYSIRVALKSDGKILSSDTRALAVVKRPVSIKEGQMPFCGMCWSFFSGSNQMFSSVDRIGAKWVEMPNMTWRKLEPIKGQYIWPNISCARTNGRKIKFTLAHLPGTPEWAMDPAEIEEVKKAEGKISKYKLLPSAKHMDDWRKFIHELVSHYKGQIDIIEIGGEDDLTFGDNSYYLKKYPQHAKQGKITSGPAYERYVEMLQIACSEIRATAPELKIGIVRPSGGDCPEYPFASGAIGKCKDIFDFLPLDCYCGNHYIGPEKSQTPVPEDFLPTYMNNALKLCNTEGNKQHIYVSEIGYALDYNVPPDSHDALEMVKRLARMYLVARITKGCEGVHWFTPNVCVESEKYAYGLWRFGQPLPTVSAYSTVARIVENVEDFKELNLGGDSKTVIFKKDGHADAALWFVSGNGKLSLEDIPESLVISDVTGGNIPVQKTLIADEFPIYFSLNGNDAYDKLLNMFSKASMICQPVKTAFLPVRSDKGVLQLQNIAGKDINANITIDNTISQTQQTILLQKNQLATIDIPLSQRPGTVKISVNCGKDYENIEESYPVEFEHCPRIKFNGRIDGNISKWSNYPYISMNKREQIVPPDPWIPWEGPEQFSAKVYTGWDEKYFYIAADVNDKVHFNRFPTAIWRSDCLQFAFDPRLDATSLKKRLTAGIYGKDDFELGIALCEGKVTVQQWIGKKQLWENAEYIVKRDEAARKTFYELKIPFTALGITPIAGTAFGFSFVLPNDETGAGANYLYELSPGIAFGKNPAKFKRFILDE